MGKVYTVLTHDVDWPKEGPGINHILKRRSRFSDDVILKVLREGYNPYYGIRELMSIEESLGVRSTFFFRPVYDDGTEVRCYEDDIRDLVKGGWEVGLHLNSVESLNEVLREKRILEDVLPRNYRVMGCRVHYLRINLSDYWKLSKAGFAYDSSIKECRDRLCLDDTGFRVIDGVVVFPITIMDAYMFTYMGVSEDNVVRVVSEAVNMLVKRGGGLMTILWHDSSVKMIGGRAYGRVLNYLYSNEEVKILRGVDALELVSGGLIGEG